MDKIQFVNNGQPGINDTNLNLMQDNIENAIHEYEIIEDNAWEVKKYDDGRFEAWYPLNFESTATATNELSTGVYASDNILLPYPTICKNVLDYRVNACFTDTFSFPLFWYAGSGINYKIVSWTSKSSETTYRLSAYLMGTWK